MDIHIFIDAENVPLAKAIDAYDLMCTEYNVVCCDVIAKEATLSPAYKNRKSETFRIQNCDFGKNSADTWLTVCIARAIFEEPYIDLLVIISSDKDFAPIIHLAVEKKRQILLLVEASQYYVMDEYLNRLDIDRDYCTLGTIEIEASIIKVKTAQLPMALKSYYLKRYRGRSILLQRGEQLFYELPFINGMNLGQFTQLMRHYKIWSKNQKATPKFMDGIGLSIKDNRVWYQTEEELMNELM